MKELILSEQQRGAISLTETTPLPSDSATTEAATLEKEEMTLLDVMEFCSDICLAHPLTILEILHELLAPETSTESCVVPLMAEIMELRLSVFARRLRQIH